MPFLERFQPTSNLSTRVFEARANAQRCSNPASTVLAVVLRVRFKISGYVKQQLTIIDYSYCGDQLESNGIIYISGKGGKLTNMDIDCDGILSKKHGECDSSDDIQLETRFKKEVQGYNKGLKDLDAYVHSYVVLGNEGKKNNYVEFYPQSVGVEPLSVVAVVCGDKMVRYSNPFYGRKKY